MRQLVIGIVLSDVVVASVFLAAENFKIAVWYYLISTALITYYSIVETKFCKGKYDVKLFAGSTTATITVALVFSIWKGFNSVAFVFLAGDFAIGTFMRFLVPRLLYYGKKYPL